MLVPNVPPAELPRSLLRKRPAFALWLSVMEISLEDLRKAPFRSLTKGNIADIRSAIAYFASSAKHVGSFRWLCDQLDLEADALLRAIEPLARRAARRLRARKPRAVVVPPACVAPSEP